MPELIKHVWWEQSLHCRHRAASIGRLGKECPPKIARGRLGWERQRGRRGRRGVQGGARDLRGTRARLSRREGGGCGKGRGGIVCVLVHPAWTFAAIGTARHADPGITSLTPGLIPRVPDNPVAVATAAGVVANSDNAMVDCAGVGGQGSVNAAGIHAEAAVHRKVNSSWVPVDSCNHSGLAILLHLRAVALETDSLADAGAIDGAARCRCGACMDTGR